MHTEDVTYNTVRSAYYIERIRRMLLCGFRGPTVISMERSMTDKSGA